MGVTVWMLCGLGICSATGGCGGDDLDAACVQTIQILLSDECQSAFLDSQGQALKACMETCQGDTGCESEKCWPAWSSQSGSACASPSGKDAEDCTCSNNCLSSGDSGFDACLRNAAKDTQDCVNGFTACLGVCIS